MGKKQISSKTYQKAKKLSRIFGYISIALTIAGIFFPPALAFGALFGAVAGSLQIVQGEYEKQRNIPGGTMDMVMGGIGAGLSALDLGGTLGILRGATNAADKAQYITENMRTLGYISMGINVGLVVGEEAYGAYEYITGDNRGLGKSLMIQGGIQVGTMIGGAGVGYAFERSGIVNKFNEFFLKTAEEPTITPNEGGLPPTTEASPQGETEASSSSTMMPKQRTLLGKLNNKPLKFKSLTEEETDQEIEKSFKNAMQQVEGTANQTALKYKGTKIQSKITSKKVRFKEDEIRWNQDETGYLDYPYERVHSSIYYIHYSDDNETFTETLEETKVPMRNLNQPPRESDLKTSDKTLTRTQSSLYSFDRDTPGDIEAFLTRRSKYLQENVKMSKSIPYNRQDINQMLVKRMRDIEAQNFNNFRYMTRGDIEDYIARWDPHLKNKM